MEQNLQTIIDGINKNIHLSGEEKAVFISKLKEVDKKITITEFKLERTDKVKRTTATLLEKTIQELEQKQKAVELQNRELEIEAALERVRAVAMGMMKQGDLLDISKSLYIECQQLGFGDLRNAIIHTYDEGNYFTDYDFADFTKGHISRIPYTGNPLLEKFVQDIRGTRDAFSEMIITGDELKQWQAFRDANNEVPDERLSNASSLCYYIYSIGTASIGISTFGPISSDKLQVLKRFRNVFDLAYKRYVDITKAETQAREAQIELSLERVRAKTMAMHNSNDVADTVATMFDEVVKLGIETMRCGIGIMHEGGNMEVWTAKHDENGNVDLVIGHLDMLMHPLLKGAYESWLRKNDFYTYTLANDDLIAYFTAINNHADYPVKYDLASLPQKIVHSEFQFSEGTLFVFSLEVLPAETQKIFKRFSKVFGQTYRRYLDLKKAEGQAREARIENALERVRSIAIGMVKSDDLLGICEAVFVQLALLGFNDLRAAQIYIRNDETEEFINYDYSDATGQDVVRVKYNSHPNTKRIFDVITNAGDALVDNVIHKQELEEWKAYLYNTLGQPAEEKLDRATELHYYLYSFGKGAFGISNFATLTNEDLEILKRFRNVFSFSYKRYSDISLAEERAREAQIEAALERVRSRTLAMQKSGELAQAAAVLFRQLIGLGIAPNRLYIGVINDETGSIEFWITDEDGSKVSTMFTGNAYENSSIKKMHDGWLQQQKAIVIDMQGNELAAYFYYMGEELHVPFKEGLSQKRRIQYITYFSKGFIGLASPTEQPKETVELLERFANVFNLTFTRFNDLKVAEASALQAEQDLIEIKAARKKAEEALNELQATQKQLIQSEKMASLGELTAGIAHEIQNPLNFVNNFSEVSNELLEELQDERLKPEAERDLAIEDEILNDIKQNLEKINHHGKRADAIVKGMLQHSRKSTGAKEPTDINALADEYLRLAYQGLRAKDKSFNTTLNTSFDETIGKINIIPQDIGRVLLNLFNNAFYAVTERLKEEGEKYKPEVSISTTKVVSGIEIKIADNGNGIPQSAINKIFQPFFTTKPTGQGTGLGLSLSYDIVKAHGGEIKVETKEGEGTEFIVQLPIT